jgi:hypothetical protein
VEEQGLGQAEIVLPQQGLGVDRAEGVQDELVVQVRVEGGFQRVHRDAERRGGAGQHRGARSRGGGQGALVREREDAASDAHGVGIRAHREATPAVQEDREAADEAVIVAQLLEFGDRVAQRALLGADVRRVRLDEHPCEG